MELVAWASHKYVMHGFGWGWHRDHHEPHDRLLERNDLFALVGAERAYFGTKDAQQVRVIRRMALDLALPTEVVPWVESVEVTMMVVPQSPVRWFLMDWLIATSSNPRMPSPIMPVLNWLASASAGQLGRRA